MIVSISEQINLGTGFLDLTNTANSAIFNVPVEGGSSLNIAELGNSFAPVLPASLPTARVDLSRVTPALTRSSDGSLLFRVPGLPPLVPFEIQSSSNSGPPAFTRLLGATGAELANGIALAADPGRRLFRLAQP